MSTDHKRGVATLAEHAREQGWDVSITGANHTRFTRPDGQSIVIGATPSDVRAHENNRHQLRRFGLLDDWYDEHRDERVRRAESNGATNAATVLRFLQHNAGPASITEIVSSTGLASQQVNVALQWLLRRHPEIERPARGTYAWRPTPKLGVETYSGRQIRFGANGNGNGHAEPPAIEVHVPAERRPINVIPAALPEDLPSMFEAVTTDRDDNIVLRDENGDLSRYPHLRAARQSRVHDLPKDLFVYEPDEHVEPVVDRGPEKVLEPYRLLKLGFEIHLWVRLGKDKADHLVADLQAFHPAGLVGGRGSALWLDAFRRIGPGTEIADRQQAVELPVLVNNRELVKEGQEVGAVPTFLSQIRLHPFDEVYCRLPHVQQIRNRLTLEIVPGQAHREGESLFFFVRERETQLLGVPVGVGPDEIVQRSAGIVEKITDDQRDLIGDLFEVIDPIDVVRSICFEVAPYAVGLRIDEPLKSILENYEVVPCPIQFEPTLVQGVAHATGEER